MNNNESYFEKLFEPGRIGKVVVPNRIVFPPMATKLCDSEGGVTERLIKYHQRRAQGGAGLLGIEAAYMMNDGGVGFSSPNVLGIFKDSQIAGLSRLVDAVHDYGAKISIQPQHAGRQAIYPRPVSISDIPCGNYKTPVRKLTSEELKEIEDNYAEAALRAKKAGFDFVNLHFANGYLFSQSLSPKFNNRTDEYGGTFERRLRLCLNVIDKTKKKVGMDFPLYCRIATQEFVEGGLTIEDTVKIVKEFENAGLDAIDLNNGIRESVCYTIPPFCLEPGFAADLSAEVKKAVNIPVFIAGRINTPQLAEKILEEGKADFISMGRALIVDPDLPQKAKNGEVDFIRPCIGCNCCRRGSTSGLSLRCAVNPVAGREIDLDKLPEASNPKKVVIIGAGPSGLEAAITASKRGHNVELYEKESRIGGTLNLACKPPLKHEIYNIVKYYKNELKRNKVKVNLNTEITSRKIKDLEADEVIIAIGSEPLRLQVPGYDRENVYTSHDVLNKNNITGKTIAVIGGGSMGCEIAEYLAEQGKNVKIIEMLDDLATGIDTAVKYCLINRLKDLGVTFMCGFKLLEITDKGIKIINKNSAILETQHLNVDAVVLSVGVKSRKNLKECDMKHIHVIGDAREPGEILDAISSGHHIGRLV